MKCVGKFKFRGLEKKEGGVFENEKGQQITYKGSYALKLDELVDGEIFERTFKIPLDSPLIEPLSKVQLYTDISIEFEIRFYRNSINLVPIAIKQ